MTTVVPVPEEFKKIMGDFVGDILISFPEYAPLVGKWWVKDDEAKVASLYKYCLSIYPENMMNILYQKEELFSETSTVCTDFLPGISFKYIWNDNISEKTKSTLWKYLQLVLMTISSSMMDQEGFKESLKMFEHIDETEFKEKWEETMKSIEGIFSANDESASESEPTTSSSIPSSSEMYNNISGLMNGKLGQIAKEIAEETAQNFQMDMDNVGSTEDIMKKMFENPGKMMSLVKSVSDKLDSKMKSGEINQSDLMKEATSVLQNMKDIPGLDNIQSILEKFGGQIPGLGKNMKIDKNAMEAKLSQEKKRMDMRERMKKNMERKQVEKALAVQQASLAAAAAPAKEPSIDEILASLEKMTKSGTGSETVTGKETQPKPSSKSKEGKDKKKKKKD